MTKTQTIVRHLHKEHYFLVGSLFLLVSLLVLYVYFLSATVVHVVMHKEVQQAISEQHSIISSLEATYIALQHDMSNSIASLDGYVVVEEKIFIDRAQSALVLRDE